MKNFIKTTVIRVFIAAMCLLIFEVMICYANEETLLSEGSSRQRSSMITLKPAIIDRVYRSKEGPSDRKAWKFETKYSQDQKRGDLIWLTGMRTEIVDAITNKQQSQEFFCHTSLLFDRKKEKSRKAINKEYQFQRKGLFSLFQSRTEIQLPKNFGVPIYSGEALNVVSMFLNNNEVPQKPIQLKARNIINYVYDQEIDHPIKPLIRRNYELKVKVKKGEHAGSHHDDLNEDDTIEPAKQSLIWLEEGADKSQYIYHWMVPPGRHVYRYRLAEGLNIPYDTTAHYITGHIHPFGQYVELNDLTTGKTVYRVNFENGRDRREVVSANYFSSEEGMPLFKDHEYELVTEYHNTSPEAADAMAKIYVFYLDKDFDKEITMD